MRIRLLLLVLSLLLSGCAPETDSSDRSRPLGQERVPLDTTWGEIFFDDFVGGQLDRSVWNVRGPDLWVNREEQIYIDSSWTIVLHEEAGDADGVLALTARYVPGWQAPNGRVADFVSGRINTRDTFDFQYGRAEARLRLPAAVGMWPAFWLLGYGRWPGSGEIDIMEYVGEKDWTAVGGMYPYKINGVESPYLGLPEATADRIRETGLAMEVDWVRVSRDPERHRAP